MNFRVFATCVALCPFFLSLHPAFAQAPKLNAYDEKPRPDETVNGYLSRLRQLKSATIRQEPSDPNDLEAINRWLLDVALVRKATGRAQHLRDDLDSQLQIVNDRKDPFKAHDPNYEPTPEVLSQTPSVRELTDQLRALQRNHPSFESRVADVQKWLTDLEHKRNARYIAEASDYTAKDYFERLVAAQLQGDNAVQSRRLASRLKDLKTHTPDPNRTGDVSVWLSDIREVFHQFDTLLPLPQKQTRQVAGTSDLVPHASAASAPSPATHESAPAPADHGVSDSPSSQPRHPVAPATPPFGIYLGNDLAVPSYTEFSRSMTADNGWDDLAKHRVAALVMYAVDFLRGGEPTGGHGSLFGWKGNRDSLQGKDFTLTLTDENDPLLRNLRLFPHGVPADAESATYVQIDPKTRQQHIRTLLLVDRAGRPPENISDARQAKQWVALHLAALLGREIFGDVQQHLERKGLPKQRPTRAQQIANATSATRAGQVFLERLLANDELMQSQSPSDSSFLRQTVQEHVDFAKARISSLMAERRR